MVQFYPCCHLVFHLYSVVWCGSGKYPYFPHRRDWKFRGGVGGVSKTQKFKAMYEAKLDFQRGWEGGHWANPFRGGGGMDIFWNHPWQVYLIMNEKNKEKIRFYYE